MRLYPTQVTFHVALAGALVLSMGLAARAPVAVAYGGAMVLAVAIGRAAARVSVATLRKAGFEMVWGGTKRVVRTTRGEEITVIAELRNRDTRDARGVQMRVVSSTMLSVKLEKDTFDLRAGAVTRIPIRVTGTRVGRWGIHGLALEVRSSMAGGESLYEAPLIFANPFGVEVLPRVSRTSLASALGGRARKGVEAGRPARSPGDGDELRELREHMPGDPFKRIAWRASARRGKLLVRSMERHERDVVWFVVDVSVELWAGELGEAPLDSILDEVASLASEHLSRGDRVGLLVVASRVRTFLAPSAGHEQKAAILAALTSAASLVDDDRCDLDELEIAARVLEHARPLEPRTFAHLRTRDLDRVASASSALRQRAPFSPRLPQAPTPREQTLRHYLASFGIEVPPRTDGERERTHSAMVSGLERVLRDRHSPTQVHVFSTAPSPGSPLLPLLRKMRAKRIFLTWSLPTFTRAASEEWEQIPTSLQEAIAGAVRVRTQASRLRGEQMLRQLGIRSRVRRAQEKFRAGS